MDEISSFFSDSPSPPVEKLEQQEKQQPTYIEFLWYLSNFRNVPFISNQTKNYFYLVVYEKVAIHLELLKCLPKTETHIKYIMCWNEYIKNGNIIDDVPGFFKNKQCVLLNDISPVTLSPPLNTPTLFLDAIDISSMDIVYFKTHSELHDKPRYESTPIKLPGMVSFLFSAPFIPIERIVEFDTEFPGCALKVGNYNELTLEQAKLVFPKPHTIIFTSNYCTTENEFKLAYVLCRKKLIIRKETRQSWILTLFSSTV
jgi:hypothetical protein